ncbi:MAG: hypothetical protein LCH95_08530 [Proteobacteria bacterium]|nr:hypothetical protein [Pseudomonadota bacterium]
MAGNGARYLTAGALLAGTLVPAGDGAQAGTFDGKYVAESMRCFPNNGVSSATDVTVRNGAFQASFKADYDTQRCRVRIDADGSFSPARDCRLQVSGRIEGNRMTTVYKTDQWECTVVRVRKPDPSQAR